MTRKNILVTLILLCVVAVVLALAACGGRTAVKEDNAATTASRETKETKKEVKSEEPAETVKETPLAKKYDRIVFQKFESTSQIDADYPGAVNECENSAVEATKALKRFKSVERGAATKGKTPALVVKASVTSMRIVSHGARIWGGAFAGSSEMTLHVKLIDSTSGKVIRERDVSTANNPWAAEWTGGSSDRSLPTDLGKILADYLEAVTSK